MFIPPKPAVPAARLSFRQFLRTIRTNALECWAEEAYEQPVLRRNVMGRSNLMLNEPGAIHHVLVENAANYRRSPASVRILRPITGQGLLLSEGDTWKLQRRTIAPSLAPRVMPMLTKHIVATTDEALDALAERIDQPVDLLATMQNLTLEIAGRSMFSLEMQRYGAEMRRLLVEFGTHHARPSLLDLVLPPSIPSLGDFGRKRFQKRWMALIEAIMRDRLLEAPSDQPRDLFDLLRAARDPETGIGFNADQLRDQVSTLILAGHETTAVTLFWALMLLARVPAEQDLLARETASETTMAGLIRTRAVLNETMRLFPAAFLIAREAIGPDQAGPYQIKRRDVIMMSPWVIHRHRLLWRDPDAFDPSRFLPDAPPPPRFAFMPFGGGPRICVGAQFALTEGVLVLAAMIRRFTVALDGDRPVLPVGIVTTQPDHAPAFSLRRRDRAA